MTIFVVTDLGYGDCGKGTTVDYLSRMGSTVVVRHHGGPQAGHNVVTPNGKHHEFAQFGAGTFAGAKTFLSKHMLINPMNQMREAQHLIELGQTDVWERTYVDKGCRIITPWHVAINRLKEIRRGANRHGSVGQGLGVAVKQDIDAPSVTIRVKNIPDTDLHVRLDALRTYLADTYSDYAGDSPYWSCIDDNTIATHLAYRYKEWSLDANIVPSTHLNTLIDNHQNTIFEGAQGVLLDQWYGFHPYKTLSNCTHDNAFDLLKELKRSDPATRLGVIRAVVTTRHGAGPHPTADPDLTQRWTEPHNHKSDWQGAFRVGHLDLVAHRYAAKVCGGVDNMVVTHCDRADSWLYCDRYEQMRDIPVADKGDFAAQERVTNLTAAATPVFTAATTQQLFEAIETNIAPIAIASYGPTSGAKQMRASMLSSSTHALVV